MAQASTASTHGILNPEAGDAHFSLIRLPPATDLADVVERHWVVRWNLPPGTSFEQQLLPHPCVNLAFEGDQAMAGVHGIPSHRASRTIRGGGWVLGTKFRPGGFTPFTELPARELIDRTLSLEEAFGEADGVGLQRAVAARGDVAGRIGAVEAFLRARKPAPDPARDLAVRVVADMLTAPPDVRVSQLAARHGLSERTLQRLFRHHVGVSPKWVLRRYRLHEATERLAGGESDDLSALAHDLGYADQAHFNHDFRSTVGVSPSAYARACAAAAAPSRH
jgi:AraC-like DNA-binding protein